MQEASQRSTQHRQVNICREIQNTRREDRPIFGKGVETMKIARVFPRKTSATPTDDLCFFDGPPMLDLPEIDEIHVSVAFTYDKEKAERMAYQWEVVGVLVKIGGPAYNDHGDDFVAGKYIKQGYTMTSRGCNNNCWFCVVPRREGKIRELQIVDGFNVMDNNLLQCSDNHINAVFDMLSNQKEHPLFTGGLEAKMLKHWHCEKLIQAKTQRMFFAYDTPDDLDPLIEAGKMLRSVGYTHFDRRLYCYCLIGFNGDTFEKAENRMMEAFHAGFIPFAMLYKNEKGETDKMWRRFQREYTRPEILFTKLKTLNLKGK